VKRLDQNLRNVEAKLRDKDQAIEDNRKELMNRLASERMKAEAMQDAAIRIKDEF